MKRKTLLFSLILAMVIISLALCGADAPDGNISMDEDDFVELVVDAPLSLNYLESVYSLKAVNQIVGNEGEDGFAEVLYNANDEAEYVLATAEEGGYAIFHRMTGALMEAGEFGASPYAGQSGKKYYFGPSNYAVKDVNDVTTDIMRGSVMTTEQITAMHQYMAEKRALVVDRSETKSYANMLSALQTANTAEQQGDASLMNVVPGDWATNPYANHVLGRGFNEVTHGSFFRLLKYTSEYGNNLEGSCTYVSTVLLLRYFDAFYAPGLIPNETIPSSWRNQCDIAGVVADENNYELSIGAMDSVYEALHKYLIALQGVQSFGDEGFSLQQYSNTLPSCTSINNYYGYIRENIEDGVFNVVKANIDENKPLEVNISYTESEDTNLKHHAVVVYAYLETEDQNYYKAHFGWDTGANGTGNIIFPSYFTSGGYNEIVSIVDNHGVAHNCSLTGYASNGCFANEGHIYAPCALGHKCGCGDTVMHTGGGLTDYWNDYNGKYAQEKREEILALENSDGTLSSDYHFCACELCLETVHKIEYSPMSTGWMPQFDSINMFKFLCGDSALIAPHRFGGAVLGSNGVCVKACSDCGYLVEVPHIGGYTYFARVNYHITTCTNCGGTFQENHAYAIGISGCVLCGYGAGLGGGIIKSI